MNESLYTGASGMELAQRRLELAANNLANSTTPGYRPRRAFAATLANARSRPGRLASNQGVGAVGTWENPAPGMLRPTGQPLDVAFAKNELLAVRADGGTRYTRAGALQIGPTGQLTDSAGRPVLGAGGGTIGGLTVNTTIAADGRIMDGEAELGRLLVVRDAAGVLEQSGDNLLEARGAGPQAVADPVVQVGWLEESGTNPVQELVRLVEAQRSFERFQRAISMTANEINKRAVNEIAGS